MPFYDYKFTDTDEIVEVRQSIKEDALTEIDGREVKRVIRPSPAHFHAPDFYENTYKKRTYIEE